MELKDLKAQIQAKNLKPFYIFTGVEVGVQDIYLEQMAKVMNADLVRVDNLAEMAKRLHNRGMFSNAHIYVLRNDKELLSNDTAQHSLLSQNANKHVLCVFGYDSIDKRSKLYKGYGDNIVEFVPLKESVLVKYIQRDIDLSEADCNRLIAVCESDYSRILLETDKVKRYAAVTKQSLSDCLHQLLADGTIYTPPKDAVFDFVDAVLKYKPKLAYSLLAESYASGEATLVLLSNLYNSAKQLLQAQSYQGDNITQATGLTPFQIKLAKGRCGIYRAGDLVELMRLTRNAERGIKIGEIEDMVAVPYVLAEFWR